MKFQDVHPNNSARLLIIGPMPTERQSEGFHVQLLPFIASNNGLYSIDYEITTQFDQPRRPRSITGTTEVRWNYG